ncbi:MAG TPA: hypothetical protein PK847_00565 [Candidatus Sumerlaeota bacterium]|nr:hypothetical protein [Candidatus Sumerlaeota bacterium]HOR26668.1 hypothetical protein [Candidatus Sumerlaeota bacterium]
MPTVILPRIGGYQIDLAALLGIAHRYDPDRCKVGGCCCSSYEVSIGRAELERITGMMPHACRYAPHLRRGGRLANPFDDDGPRNWLLETDEDGRCLFAYTNADGETRCSIHSAALDLGLEPYHVKPRACALWPLALSEDRPPVLSIQNDCFDFPCNTRRRGRARTLDPGIAELIERNFGKPFLDKLHRLITG